MKSGSVNVGLCQINNGFAGQDYFPLSVGLLQAYTQQHAREPGRYQFRLPLYRREHMDRMVERMLDADVVGFSVYVWNQNGSLELARRLKAQNPNILTVFGGPQIPHKAEAFLREHPWIDVVCHGEGEAAFLSILENYPSRVWYGIEGLSYIDAQGQFVQGSYRSRMLDVNQVPSPYLMGVFDELVASGHDTEWLGLWETNRGCPFSCTFCEWGDKAFNRLCYFDMDRLRAELEWFARHRVEFIFCCDANFGLVARDLMIAEMVVETKRRYAYPHAFSVQSAKNAAERIYAIQKLLSDHGLGKGVLLALQSVNPETLKHVRRRNISLDAFDQLQRRFKQDGIATFTDLIIGLPGETYDSFVDGVSRIISKGQHDRIQFINLSILVNAEMAEPEYRRRFGLEVVRSRIINIHGSQDVTGDGIEEIQDLVIATNTMNREDWVRARVFSWMTAFLHFDKILQIPLILIHEDCSMGYRELFEAFLANESDAWPILSEIHSFFLEKARDIQEGGPEYCHSEKWLDIWWPPDEYVMIKFCVVGKLDRFYQEAEELVTRFLTGKSVNLSQDLLHDAIELNRNLIKLPFQTKDIELTVSHNIWEFYQSVLLGRPIPLQKRECVYRINRSNETWESWDDWCRKVVWYGNKKGAYMYECMAVEEQ